MIICAVIITVCLCQNSQVLGIVKNETFKKLDNENIQLYTSDHF